MTDSPTTYKLQLGTALRSLRLAAGLKREDAQERLGCSPSKIVKIENGDVGVRLAELRDLLDLYDVHGVERSEIEELGRQALRRRPRTPYGAVIVDRFRRYFHLEEIAVELQSYENELVHGLVQTREYAWAVTESSSLHKPDDIERLVAARLARQQRFSSPDGPRLWIVMGEGVIRGQVGGPKIMQDQLYHLIELSKRRNITIQVVPFSHGAHAATGFPFSILNRGSAGPSIVYLESVTDAFFVDNPDRVAVYEYTFRRLLAHALTPADTVELLGRVASELDTD